MSEPSLSAPGTFKYHPDILNKAFVSGRKERIRHQSVADPGFPRLNLSKNLLFSKIFTENCIKMKEIGPRGGLSLMPRPNPPMPTNQCSATLQRFSLNRQRCETRDSIGFFTWWYFAARILQNSLMFSRKSHSETGTRSKLAGLR